MSANALVASLMGGNFASVALIGCRDFDFVVVAESVGQSADPGLSSHNGLGRFVVGLFGEDSSPAVAILE